MCVKKTIGAGLIATSVMTAFSYAVSAKQRENFKEPLLLSRFVKRLTPKQNAFLRVAGWPLHYTLGCVWAGVYLVLMKPLQRKPALGPTLLFGSASGATGILIWRALFRQHPRPPRTDRPAFYRQLFAAHLLFTFSLAASFGLMQEKPSAERRE